MITQQDWRKEKNNDTNIKRSIVRGCAKETESERERKIWRNNKKFDGKVDDSSPLKKVIGFDGLLSSPDYIEEPNDFLSKVEGSPGCRSHSYGYTNSRGFICMNPEQVKLLTTRGGNA